MNGKAAVVLLSGLLFACVQNPPPPAPAPAPPPAPVAAPAPGPAPVAEAPRGNRRVTILTARCARYLQLSDDDRGAATMFYIGYRAQRLGAREINVDSIPGVGVRAVRYCEAHPNRAVYAAFTQAMR